MRALIKRSDIRLAADKNTITNENTVFLSSFVTIAQFLRKHPMLTTIPLGLKWKQKVTGAQLI